MTKITMILNALVFFSGLNMNAVSQNKKALIIGIDGCKPDVLQKAETPHINSFLPSIQPLKERAEQMNEKVYRFQK